ncbi:MAG: RagB/SusD family nutrient uptake outer membrane protein [Prevotella sp.]|nr:RagB/SusD family nutrient uptake outer membrane protein [Prevotella sp.]MBR1557514.1 RagB/SusD family nutrient uptake outer membrane protein [Prevotella sp.]
MKTKSIKYILAAGLVCCGLSTSFTSCGDVLDEQPRSQFDPTFFTTKAGIEGGLTSLYAHLRYFYGNGYYLNSLETGTDEYTYAQSADGNFKDADLSGVGQMNSSNSIASGCWSAAFANINTASGIIENGASAGIDDALLAEAYFFRAFDYFILVQTYGGVPLDLGAGELKFNTSTIRTSVRNTVPEVYAAIFSDLEKAVSDLPENPRLTGTATKNLARLYLSKAYLTYAWWLENPNNIPTYPECSRDASQAQSYFQKAFDTAKQAINNPGPYGLQPTFYDVNVATNDRNSEIMLYADHDEDEKFGNGGAGYGWGNGGSPENFAYWMETWNYTEMQAISASGGKINPIQREAVQALGRPWTRMAPIADNFMEGGVWEDAVKAIDSRYDATFTLRYHTNWQKSGNTEPYVIGANGMQVGPNEVYFSWVPESEDSKIDYTVSKEKFDNGNGNLGFGVMPDRADFVVAVNHISRKKYPINWKIGIYRTDNDGGLGSKVNGGSPRPWNIAKFSEFYLIAAEAAVKLGKNSDAKDMVNVLRARAGKQTFSQNDNVAVTVDNSEAMLAATPDNITIDFILDERSREFWGEGYRWFDLVRTQTWADRATTYRIAGSGYADKDLATYTRNIPAGYYIRPIPQSQLDGMIMSQEEKDAYQNPAYRN